MAEIAYFETEIVNFESLRPASVAGIIDKI
jgi:hypothetical protein